MGQPGGTYVFNTWFALSLHCVLDILAQNTSRKYGFAHLRRTSNICVRYGCFSSLCLPIISVQLFSKSSSRQIMSTTRWKYVQKSKTRFVSHTRHQAILSPSSAHATCTTCALCREIRQLLPTPSPLPDLHVMHVTKLKISNKQFPARQGNAVDARKYLSV